MSTCDLYNPIFIWYITFIRSYNDVYFILYINLYWPLIYIAPPPPPPPPPPWRLILIEPTNKADEQNHRCINATMQTMMHDGYVSLTDIPRLFNYESSSGPCNYTKLQKMLHVIQKQWYPDSKDHGTNIGRTWVLSAPDGPHVRPMNLAIRVYIIQLHITYHSLNRHQGNWYQLNKLI